MKRTLLLTTFATLLALAASIGGAASPDRFRHSTVGPNGGEPSIATALDGTLYISYDRNRKTDGEILLARFTEADILALISTVQA